MKSFDKVIFTHDATHKDARLLVYIFGKYFNSVLYSSMMYAVFFLNSDFQEVITKALLVTQFL